jgi:membrane protein involved in colicin uptake
MKKYVALSNFRAGKGLENVCKDQEFDAEESMGENLCSQGLAKKVEDEAELKAKAEAELKAAAEAEAKAKKEAEAKAKADAKAKKEGN